MSRHINKSRFFFYAVVFVLIGVICMVMPVFSTEPVCKWIKCGSAPCTALGCFGNGYVEITGGDTLSHCIESTTPSQCSNGGSTTCTYEYDEHLNIYCQGRVLRHVSATKQTTKCP